MIDIGTDTDFHIDPVDGLRAVIMEIFMRAGPAYQGVAIGEFPTANPTGDYVGIEEIDGENSELGGLYVMSVDTFATSRSRAISLAGAINLGLLRYAGGVKLSSDRWFQIDSVECSQSPRKEDWDGTKIRRQSATYDISVRR